MGKLILSALLFIGPGFSLAQNVVGTNRLVSEVDQNLAIYSIAVAPAQDNVNGLYAGPLFAHLSEIVKTDTQYDFAPAKLEESVAPENFQENPSRALKVIRDSEAQALLSLRVERGTKGTSLILGLSTLPDGRILFLERTEPLPEASIEALKTALEKLYVNLKAKLPFDGLLMSRRGQQATINFGKAQAVKPGEIIDVIQVVGLERHPKFDFLISATKTVLGSIEVTKVDDSLSFARIVNEREPGIITKGAKLDRRDFVEYPPPAPSGGASDLHSLPDKDVAFGDQPEVWVPVSAPTFGTVLLYFGLGTYNSNIDITATGDSSAVASTAQGSHTAKASLVPSLALDGEIWINPNWSLIARLDQSAFKVNNPSGNSTPGELHFTLSQQSLMVGYNFLLTENYFGPKLQLLAGIGSHKVEVDRSQPLILSSTTYSGPRFGIKGDMDLPIFTRLRLGASLMLVPTPKFSANPSISGNSSNMITQFQVYGSYKMGERYRLYSGLDLQSYSTSFSGQKRRPDANEVNSTSQRMTRILLGGQYFF